ncbi:M48 family metalloprotease [Parvularcula marina]|uniref:PDZ domain-containing protein n=1 Tax=Parvularcula marina TaxID=2292771 RepID=A0A371RJP0_9PROT|nr:M48 family metalloprotease [Parvularcula marina]RFB05636.1 PDZ domain-containing protein [Parvularcula marina]
MRFCSVLLLMFLGACASPDFAAPSLDEAVVAAERKAAIEDAMETALSRRARVYDLSWPILTANTELCPKVRPSLGTVLADRKQLARLAGGLREKELDFIGVPDELTIMHVMAGSPADRAGIPSGARLIAVEGEAVEEPKDAADKIRERTKEEEPVTLTIADGAGRRDVTLSGVERCDYAVKISTSQAINAHAYSGDIVIYTGVIRSLEDEALRYLISHEAAHLIAEHRAKYIRNVTVSGAVITGPVLYVAGGLADRLAGAADEPPDISYRARALRFLAPWAEEFEAEADYLGLYLFARAGGDLHAAGDVFHVFSRETPAAIYARSTHPLTPERLARLRAAIDEIEAKEAAGEDLMPERVEK